MGDILIRGASMPKGENAYVELQVWGDGKVYKRRGLAGKFVQVGTAVPLPEGHGRLIDADALYEEHTRLAYKGDYAFHITARAWLENAPTIVPAEGGTDECSEN